MNLKEDIKVTIVRELKDIFYRFKIFYFGKSNKDL
jgi:hypothetical protein